MGLLVMASNSETVYMGTSIAGFALAFTFTRLVQSAMFFWSGYWLPREVRVNVFCTKPSSF